MRSSADTPSRAAGTFEKWNRRLHYYLGLYQLFFIWLFCFTGLLLNHPTWSFADFWPTRRESVIERAITRPAPGTDLEQAREILSQLGLRGEIEWTAERDDSRRFDFRASRPGHMFDIKTDLERGWAKVQRIDVNGWGIMRILHTFSGVRADDERNGRDWFLTSAWALSMDAVAAGLAVMVLGSYYMWWRLPRRRTGGLIALLSGWVVCALFVAGLKLLR